MDKLNTFRRLTVLDQDGMDALTVTNMGETIALSQVAEDGTLHNVVIGIKQAEELLDLLDEEVG